MKITKFELYSFRNLEKFSIMPSEAFNGFWGENGQGKTNILEALYISIKGKSFRPYSQKKDWIPKVFHEIGNPKTSSGIYIGLELVDGKSFPLTIHTKWTSGGQHGKWSFFFNGKKSTSAKIYTKVPLIAFSPDDHALIRQGPELRRSFIDDVFSDVIPGYSEVLTRFEKSLKNRNQILKKQKKEEIFKITPELSTWTEMMAQESQELSTLRTEAWKTFSEYFRPIAEELMESPLKVDCQWLPGIKLENFSTEDIIEYLLENLMADLALGYTTRGPQRDDFQILLDGENAKGTASQAQARILALALKWAHTDWLQQERAQKAIFIIDDFSSELDIVRRSKLIDRICHNSSQLFVTGTDLNMVPLEKFSDIKNYQVAEGTLHNFKNSLETNIEN